MATYTLESVEETLLDNADFEEVGSVSKAKAFVTAANRWMILSPESSSNQSSSLSMNKASVETLKARALAFIQVNDKRADGASSKVSFYGYDRQ